MARERSRFLRDKVRTTIKLCDPGLTTDDGLCVGPQETIHLHYDKWINAYQAEIWDTVTPPPRTSHDFKVLDQMGRSGPITSVFAFKDIIRDIKRLNRLELSFLENDVDLPFGYQIGAPETDNNYMRNHQVPKTQNPSDNQNTVMDNCYQIDFQRGHFFTNIDEIAPVRYRNGMMMPGNAEARDDNLIEMRWVLQREFASSVVFFHKVTIPPGAIEGTHRHIGTEELYCIVEGQGVAYMGERSRQRPIRSSPRAWLGVRYRASYRSPGSVISPRRRYPRDPNNSTTDLLRFVAFRCPHLLDKAPKRGNPP